MMTETQRQQIESAISAGTNRLHDATRWYEDDNGESRIIDDVAESIGHIIDAAVKEEREAAVKEEREACAKIAERQAFSHAYRGFENGPELNSAAIANAIRKRGKR